MVKAIDPLDTPVNSLPHIEATTRNLAESIFSSRHDIFPPGKGFDVTVVDRDNEEEIFRLNISPTNEGTDPLMIISVYYDYSLLITIDNPRTVIPLKHYQDEVPTL